MHEEGCWVEHAWRGNNYAEMRTQPNTPCMPRMFIHLCLSTSLTALHYSGSYVHSWVHVRLVVPVPRVLHIDGTILAWHMHLDARCIACWQKDEQSSRKKIEWKNIDSGRLRRSKEPRGGASALIIFSIIQWYKIDQSSPQWTGRVRNTAAQCSYIILVHG